MVDPMTVNPVLTYETTLVNNLDSGCGIIGTGLRFRHQSSTVRIESPARCKQIYVFSTIWRKSKVHLIFYKRIVFLSKKWAIPGLFFLYFRLINRQLTVNKCSIYK